MSWTLPPFPFPTEAEFRKYRAGGAPPALLRATVLDVAQEAALIAALFWSDSPLTPIPELRKEYRARADSLMPSARRDLFIDLVRRAYLHRRPHHTVYRSPSAFVLALAYGEDKYGAAPYDKGWDPRGLKR